LVIVRPATVIAWHRRGFAWYWTRRSRPKGGRPAGRRRCATPDPKDCPSEPALGRAAYSPSGTETETSFGRRCPRLRGRWTAQVLLPRGGIGPPAGFSHTTPNASFRLPT
jgi:hypothetical protein